MTPKKQLLITRQRLWLSCKVVIFCSVYTQFILLLLVCSVCNFFLKCDCSSDSSKLKGVDESNALVLPANKSKKKTSSLTRLSTKKPLTKRQKRELLKVLERKEKKAQVTIQF